MSTALLPGARPLAILALVLLPLLGGLSASAQTGPLDEAVRPLNLTLSLSETIDAGASWYDGETLRVRGLTVAFAVDGDLSGTATLQMDLDWMGPCDGEALSCDGNRQAFATVELVTEEAAWSGSLALEMTQDETPRARGILIGRHGATDQVIVIDEVTAFEVTTMSVAGRVATLDGPIGGVQLSHSACITGPTTADGAFLGGRGLVDDSGPARIVRQELGAGHPFGVYGDVTDIGQKGILRASFVAGLHDRHAHGNFVLVGESGPYRGMLGYGRALMSLSDEPRCASGLLATSTWTGQARYISDPATFLAPAVYFRTPTNGATVPTPVEVDLAAEHVAIEPAGVARDGAGYLAIMIDAPCIGPGEPVPEDEQHIHLREGETSAALSLFSGKHRLCLQLVDGAGIAQPATDVITITVSSSGGDGDL